MPICDIKVNSLKTRKPSIIIGGKNNYSTIINTTDSIDLTFDSPPKPGVIRKIQEIRRVLLHDSEVQRDEYKDFDTVTGDKYTFKNLEEGNHIFRVAEDDHGFESYSNPVNINVYDATKNTFTLDSVDCKGIVHYTLNTTSKSVYKQQVVIKKSTGSEIVLEKHDNFPDDINILYVYSKSFYKDGNVLETEHIDTFPNYTCNLSWVLNKDEITGYRTEVSVISQYKDQVFEVNEDDAGWTRAVVMNDKIQLNENKRTQIRGVMPRNNYTNYLTYTRLPIPSNIAIEWREGGTEERFKDEGFVNLLSQITEYPKDGNPVITLQIKVDGIGDWIDIASDNINVSSQQRNKFLEYRHKLTYDYGLVLYSNILKSVTRYVSAITWSDGTNTPKASEDDTVTILKSKLTFGKTYKLKYKSFNIEPVEANVDWKDVADESNINVTSKKYWEFKLFCNEDDSLSSNVLKFVEEDFIPNASIKWQDTDDRHIDVALFSDYDHGIAKDFPKVIKVNFSVIEAGRFDLQFFSYTRNSNLVQDRYFHKPDFSFYNTNYKYTEEDRANDIKRNAIYISPKNINYNQYKDKLLDGTNYLSEEPCNNSVDNSNKDNVSYDSSNITMSDEELYQSQLSYYKDNYVSHDELSSIEAQAKDYLTNMDDAILMGNTFRVEGNIIDMYQIRGYREFINYMFHNRVQDPIPNIERGDVNIEYKPISKGGFDRDFTPLFTIKDIKDGAEINVFNGLKNIKDSVKYINGVKCYISNGTSDEDILDTSNDYNIVENDYVDYNHDTKYLVQCADNMLIARLVYVDQHGTSTVINNWLYSYYYDNSLVINDKNFSIKSIYKITKSNNRVKSDIYECVDKFNILNNITIRFNRHKTPEMPGKSHNVTVKLKVNTPGSDDWHIVSDNTGLHDFYINERIPLKGFVFNGEDPDTNEHFTETHSDYIIQTYFKYKVYSQHIPYYKYRFSSSDGYGAYKFKLEISGDYELESDTAIFYKYPVTRLMCIHKDNVIGLSEHDVSFNLYKYSDNRKLLLSNNEPSKDSSKNVLISQIQIRDKRIHFLDSNGRCNGDDDIENYYIYHKIESVNDIYMFDKKFFSFRTSISNISSISQYKYFFVPLKTILESVVFSKDEVDKINDNLPIIYSCEYYKTQPLYLICNSIYPSLNTENCIAYNDSIIDNSLETYKDTYRKLITSSNIGINFISSLYTNTSNRFAYSNTKSNFVDKYLSIKLRYTSSYNNTSSITPNTSVFQAASTDSQDANNSGFSEIDLSSNSIEYSSKFFSQGLLYACALDVTGNSGVKFVTNNPDDVLYIGSTQFQLKKKNTEGQKEVVKLEYIDEQPEATEIYYLRYKISNTFSAEFFKSDHNGNKIVIPDFVKYKLQKADDSGNNYTDVKDIDDISNDINITDTGTYSVKAYVEDTPDNANKMIGYVRTQNADISSINKNIDDGLNVDGKKGWFGFCYPTGNEGVRVYKPVFDINHNIPETYKDFKFRFMWMMTTSNDAIITSSSPRRKDGYGDKLFYDFDNYSKLIVPDINSEFIGYDQLQGALLYFADMIKGDKQTNSALYVAHLEIIDHANGDQVKGVTNNIYIYLERSYWYFMYHMEDGKKEYAFQHQKDIPRRVRKGIPRRTDGTYDSFPRITNTEYICFGTNVRYFPQWQNNIFTAVPYYMSNDFLLQDLTELRASGQTQLLGYVPFNRGHSIPVTLADPPDRGIDWQQPYGYYMGTGVNNVPNGSYRIFRDIILTELGITVNNYVIEGEYISVNVDLKCDWAKAEYPMPLYYGNNNVFTVNRPGCLGAEGNYKVVKTNTGNKRLSFHFLTKKEEFWEVYPNNRKLEDSEIVSNEVTSFTDSDNTNVLVREMYCADRRLCNKKLKVWLIFRDKYEVAYSEIEDIYVKAFLVQGNQRYLNRSGRGDENDLNYFFDGYMANRGSAYMVCTLNAPVNFGFMFNFCTNYVPKWGNFSSEGYYKNDTSRVFDYLESRNTRRWCSNVTNNNCCTPTANHNDSYIMHFVEIMKDGRVYGSSNLLLYHFWYA